jgi:hypothetical protein
MINECGAFVEMRIGRGKCKGYVPLGLERDPLSLVRASKSYLEEKSAAPI